MIKEENCKNTKAGFGEPSSASSKFLGAIFPLWVKGRTLFFLFPVYQVWQLVKCWGQGRGGGII